MVKELFTRISKFFFKGSRKDNKGRQLYIVGADYPCYKDPEMPCNIEYLRPMQSCFRDKYNPGRNCIVDAGTGEGKSPIAFIASRYFLDAGKKIMMTAPTKELVNDLYRSAVATHGRNVVAICTGTRTDPAIDRKSFIVATPEKYIAEVRAGKPWVKEIGLVIGDEAHNLYDNTRGGSFDVALAIARALYGAKLLLMSGTIPDRQRMIEHFDADCFVCGYESTRLRIEERIVIDDFDAADLSVSDKKKTGMTYNKDSARLRDLKSLLEEHKEKAVLIFVPTKVVGFCLSQELNVPFHCADVAEDDKKRIISLFNSGELKALIATTTLAQGVNTPCDVVIIFGTRSGGNYLDYYVVRQEAGRAGRNKAEALAYILADRVELHNSKRKLISKSLPLPVETMLLTLFSIKQDSTKADLCAALEKTFAATFWKRPEIEEKVDRCLKLLSSYKILHVSLEGEYSLTSEGILIAKYMISPLAYIKYIKAARKIEPVRMADTVFAKKASAEIIQTTGAAPSDREAAELSEKWVKGVLLLGLIYSETKGAAPGTFTHKYFMEFNTRLPQIGFNTDLGLDSNALAKWAALLKYWSLHPGAAPSYLRWQLEDISMWLYMMRDMEKYGINKPMPGKEQLNTAIKALQVACAKAEAGRKKKVQPLPLFAFCATTPQKAFSVVEKEAKAA